jgi:hypothetical protein
MPRAGEERAKEARRLTEGHTARNPVTSRDLVYLDAFVPADGQSLATDERARTSDRWRYRDIDTNHMLFSTRPEEVIDLLLEVA